MMRIIYITTFYKHNKTYTSRDKLALQIRHSTTIVAKNYMKIKPYVKEPNEELQKIKEDTAKLVFTST